MKKINILLVLLATVEIVSWAQNDTILIDFGSSTYLSEEPWNNLSNPQGDGDIKYLKNSNNLYTPMNINVYDRFNGINSTGVSDPDSAIKFPSSATRDSYYGSVVEFGGSTEPTGGMNFAALDTSKYFTFQIFASRNSVSDNRETKYRFEGKTIDSLYLNTSNNQDSVVSITLKPNADSIINLIVSPGENNNNSYGFYYLGALKMIYSIESPLPSTLTLDSPNGGEIVEGMTFLPIQWTAINIIDSIKIQYSSNNGITWNDIVTTSPEANSYNWEVPNIISDSCFIRVSSGGVHDSSDNVFAIIESSNILYDSIYIDFGSSNTISLDPWNNFTNLQGGGKIEMLRNSNNLYTGYSADVVDRFNGINETGTMNPDLNLGFPSTATTDNYYGSVVEFSGSAEPTGAIEFANLDINKTYYFEVFASRMNVSDDRETKYKFSGSLSDSVYLKASNNENSVVKFSLAPSTEGKILLTVSPGENNTNNPYKFYYLGAIKMFYEEEEPLPPSLELVSPNGSEIFQSGTSQTILWKGINLTNNVIISYSSNSGATWDIIDTVGQSESSYNWIVPEIISQECLIRLESSGISDESDYVFRITDGSETYVRLNYPLGGLNLLQGSSYNISWNSNLLSSYVKIELSLDNGNSWNLIDSVESSQKAYLWDVSQEESEECLLRLRSGEQNDQTSGVFKISKVNCSKTIVVIGSSTAYGVGATPIDSSWVNRYTDLMYDIDPEIEVINISLGGYTTYQLLPTGTIIPPGVNEMIDENRNITKALNYSPFAIIINLPSNDAVKYYSVEEQIDNFNRMIDSANIYGAMVYIATTQPRNFSDAYQINIQERMKDTINLIYGRNAIDFWTELADSDSKLSTIYNSGDGVHLNNLGHKLLFNRVQDKRLDTLVCPTHNTSIPLVLSDLNEISLYPNPVKENSILYVNSPKGGEIHLTLYDVTGRIISQYNSKMESGSKNEFSVFEENYYSLKNGVLFLDIRIIDSQNVVSNKVIKLIKL